MPMPNRIFSFNISMELKEAYKQAVREGKLDPLKVCQVLRKELERQVGQAYYTKAIEPSQPNQQPAPQVAKSKTTIDFDSEGNVVE